MSPHAAAAATSTDARDDACSLRLAATGMSRFNVTEIVSYFSSRAVLLVGDSTAAYKADWLLEQGVRQACDGGSGICATGHKRHPQISIGIQPREWCKRPRASFLTNRTDWDVVLWNLSGLHALHLKPALNVHRTFESLWQEYRGCASRVNAAYPKARRVILLTNDVCDGGFYGPWAAASAHWAAATTDPLYTMALSAVGSASVRVAERETARQHGMALQDSYTAGMCDCTGPGDGRHYRRLIPAFWQRFCEARSGPGAESGVIGVIGVT